MGRTWRLLIVKLSPLLLCSFFVLFCFNCQHYRTDCVPPPNCILTHFSSTTHGGNKYVLECAGPEETVCKERNSCVTFLTVVSPACPFFVA